MIFLLFVLVFLATVQSYEVPELTLENFDELTDGKTVFLFFYAPWCPHCKKMTPEFAEFAEKWKDHPVGFVGKVDCTTRTGKILCDEHGIRGYPSLMWGDPAHLKDFKGQHARSEYEKFAEENLVKPMCNAANVHLCDKETREKIETFMAMDESELDALIKEEEDKLVSIEKTYSDSVAQLQARYTKLLAEKDDKVKKVREMGLATLRSVRAFKEKELFKDEL